VAGVLACHAEGVVAALPPTRQRLLRTLMLRLVTPEGTRALVEQHEAEQLGPRDEIRGLIDQLIGGRLLAAERHGDDATIELVHESLITSWPTLRRWRDESGEDAAFLDQVRSAAKQWDQRGRPASCCAATRREIRLVRRRSVPPLPARDAAALDAALALADRATRRRRRWIGGAFIGLAALVAAAAVALVWIRGAQQSAQEQRTAALAAADRARAAEGESRTRLQAFEEAEAQRQRAEADADRAAAEAKAAALAQERAQSSLVAAQGEVAQSREARGDQPAAQGRWPEATMPGPAERPPASPSARPRACARRSPSSAPAPRRPSRPPRAWPRCCADRAARPRS
jgi:hypothetical protein